jgi:hypothetical protein
MKKSFACLLPLLIFSTPTCWADDHDFEYWAETKLVLEGETLGLPAPYEFFLAYKNRRDRDWDHVFTKRFLGGVEYHFEDLKGWTVGAFFSAIDNQGGSDENRTSLNLIKEWEDLGETEWDLEFRNRYELRQMEDLHDWEYRVRFRVQLAHPTGVEMRHGEIDWYTSTEAFYDFQEDLWNSYRIDSGLNIPLLENLDLKLGYRLEGNERGEGGGWDEDSIVLTEFTYTF